MAKKKEHRDAIYLRVPQWVREWCESEAKRSGISVPDVVRQLLMRTIQERDLGPGAAVR